ncbi:MAG: SCP2 sterol-binding domain-containing protein [Epulopiscium sp.]|nr:SCP2 sterol-binding domain-containing protein [Candidatus Epulonipiscium sp.]
MRVIILKSGKEDPIIEEILQSISKVLGELQVEVREIQLDVLSYYKGYDTEEIKEILGYINQAAGVIVASRVELLSISGSLSTFFEYCSAHKGSEIFKKPIFSITSTDWRGEREAGEYILHAWSILGGSEFGKLGIYAPVYESQKDEIQNNLERMTEDFYRMIKQDRRPIVGSDFSNFSGQGSNHSGGFGQVLSKEEEKYEGHTGEKDIGNRQERDIEDLANFFEKQLSEVEDKESNIPKPQLKTTRHMISSLPHYFQGQYDSEFNATIQYHMLAEESFSGYITIENGECIFNEGVYQGADVELTADEDIFKEILTKRLTTQKAFMLGQLKVRGNFMLLAKLDQIFKAM